MKYYAKSKKKGLSDKERGKQIKEPEKMDEHSFLSAETIRTDVNQADVIQVADLYFGNQILFQI